MNASLVPRLLCGGGEKKKEKILVHMPSSPRISEISIKSAATEVALCCVVILLTCFVLQSL